MRRLIIPIITVFSCFSFLTTHTFPFNPPKEMVLLKGYEGVVQHPVSTKIKEAQQFFDQGLTLIYAFNHDAAYWSFQKATLIDPNLAMGYWGMALSLGANINMNITEDREKKAYEHIQKALSLSQYATENEKDYIQALSARYTNSDKPNFEELSLNYYKAMQDLIEKYPYDLDAATLYAESGLNLNPWHQWTSDGLPLKGTREIVEVLERTLKWEPNHLGANHYYIHAIEASRNPERALMSAERLKTLLPNAGHILHMPGHIYLLVGDYHQAAISNEQAVKADMAYIKEFGMDGIYPLHYLSHNLYFLSRAYALEGRYTDAINTAQKLNDFYAPYVNSMPDMEYYVPATLFINLRFHRWNEVLKEEAPPNNLAVTKALWHFARAIAFASLNDRLQADTEKKLFLEAKANIPASAEYGYNKASNILKLAELQINAKMADMAGDFSNATKFYTEAIGLQDELYYNEPPDWYFPLREAFGGLLLRNNLFLEAALVFNSDLERHPRNGRSLFGLWQALSNNGKPSDAYWIKLEFDKAWQYSEKPLTINDL